MWWKCDSSSGVLWQPIVSTRGGKIQSRCGKETQIQRLHPGWWNPRNRVWWEKWCDEKTQALSDWVYCVLCSGDRVFGWIPCKLCEKYVNSFIPLKKFAFLFYFTSFKYRKFWWNENLGPLSWIFFSKQLAQNLKKKPLHE